MLIRRGCVTSSAASKKFPFKPAYQWWNSQQVLVADSLNNHLILDLNSPPEIVLPHVAHSIWSKICPIFLLFVIDEQDARSYWESIQTIVNMFSGSDDHDDDDDDDDEEEVNVPNPISHFPEFIESVYSLQDVLTPKTVRQCIFFINKFGFNDPAHFFLYQSPVFFLDPLLYLETLLELRYIKHSLWVGFVQNYFLVDSFLEMYGGFLVPIQISPSKSTRIIFNDVSKHRILLTEIFFSLIVDSFKIHPNIVNIALKFLDTTISVVSLSNRNSVSISIYRTIFALFDKLIENSVSKEQLISRASQLFESADEDSLYVTFKYLFGKKLISSSDVLRLISERGIQSLTDFQILSEVADSSTVIPAIIFILRTSLHSHLWHRSCFSLVRRFLVKHSLSRPDIRDLMQVIIRRIFLWISFAAMRRKYRIRSIMLCESMIMLLESHLIWLQNCILSSASSILSKPTPVYFRSFFGGSSSAPIDDLSIHEWETFNVSKVKLKTFPFDSTKGNLIMPQNKDNVSASPSFSSSMSRSVAPSYSQKLKVKIVQRGETKKAKSTASSSTNASNSAESTSMTSIKIANCISSSSSSSYVSSTQTTSTTTTKKKVGTAKLKKCQSTSGGSVVIRKPKNMSRPSTTQSESKLFSKRKDVYF